MEAAALAQERAECVLVATNQERQDLGHGWGGIRRSSSRRSARPPVRGASFRRKIQSRPDNRQRRCRNHSRKVRLSRLRSTERFNTRFGTTKPSRGYWSRFGFTSTAIPRPRSNFPVRRTVTKSGLDKRQRRGRLPPSPYKVATGESDGEARTPLGSARPDDGAAAAGTHSLQKAVRALPFYDRRLVSALHDLIPDLFISGNRTLDV